MDLPTNQEVQYHKWLKDDTIKVKLMKMSKSYQWELSCEGEDSDAVIARLQDADNKLRAIYNQPEEAQ